MKKALLAAALILMGVAVHAEITSIITFPSGTSGEVQFEEDGIFQGDDTFTYSTTTKKVSVLGVVTSTITASSATFTNATVSIVTITTVTWADGSTSTTSSSGGATFTGGTVSGSSTTFILPVTLSSHSIVNGNLSVAGGAISISSGTGFSTGFYASQGSSYPKVRIGGDGSDVSNTPFGITGTLKLMSIGTTLTDPELYFGVFPDNAMYVGSSAGQGYFSASPFYLATDVTYTQPSTNRMRVMMRDTPDTFVIADGDFVVGSDTSTAAITLQPNGYVVTTGSASIQGADGLSVTYGFSAATATIPSMLGSVTFASSATVANIAITTITWADGTTSTTSASGGASFTGGTVANATTFVSSVTFNGGIKVGDADVDPFNIVVASIQIPVTYGVNVTTTSDGTGTSILYLDGVNNRVGINDSSPATPLEVGGEVRGSKFSDWNDSTYYLDPGAATSMYVNGKVGIGADATPDTYLAVTQGAASSGVAVILAEFENDAPNSGTAIAMKTKNADPYDVQVNMYSSASAVQAAFGINEASGWDFMVSTTIVLAGASNVLAIDSAIGAIVPKTYTSAELDTKAAGAAGWYLNCSDCTPPGLYVSTGTGTGAWVLRAEGIFDSVLIGTVTFNSTTPAAASALCINAAGSLSSCTSVVDAAGGCTCP